MTVETTPARTDPAVRAWSWGTGISPSLVHYAGLIVAVPILAYLARDQWFFYDEWDFLVPSNGRALLDPHVGHWSTVPMLLFRAVRSIVGLDTYAPYVAMVIVAHLLFTHVLWRIARRAANPWIATLLAGLFSLFGAGAENIFWAFQVGFVGGLLAATTAALLVDVRELTLVRAIAAGLAGLIAVATSGTALPVMVTAVVLACYRHGWRRAGAVFGPAVLAYGVWFLTHQDPTDDQLAPKGFARLLLIPQYIGSSFVDNLGNSLFAPELAAPLLLALIAFVVVRAGHLWDIDPLAMLLGGSAVLFATTTALTRAGLGPDLASGSRYTYAVIGLLLPLSAIALSRVAAIGRAGAIAVVTFIVLVGSYNAGMLIDQANVQAAQEQESQRLVSATLEQWLADPRDAVLGLHPDPVVMPNLSIGGIVDLQEHGWFDPGEYGPTESLTAETYLAVDVGPGSIQVATCATAAGDVVVAPGEPVLVAGPTTGTAQLTLAADGVTGKPRRIELSTEPTVISYNGANTLTARGDTAALTICRPA